MHYFSIGHVPISVHPDRFRLPVYGSRAISVKSRKSKSVLIVIGHCSLAAGENEIVNLHCIRYNNENVMFYNNENVMFYNNSLMRNNRPFSKDICLNIHNN